MFAHESITLLHEICLTGMFLLALIETRLDVKIEYVTPKPARCSVPCHVARSFLADYVRTYSTCEQSPGPWMLAVRFVGQSNEPSYPNVS